jgi:outer membrane protein assembly factor BamB
LVRSAIVDIAPDGSVRWQADFADVLFNYSADGDVLPLADGGAFVTTGNGYEIARLDSAGNIVWIRNIDAHELAQASSQIVITAGCTSVTALNSNTGQSLWSYGFDYGFPCSSSTLSTDANGNVYLVVAPKQESLLTSDNLDVYKFGAAGTLLWRTRLSGTPGVVPLLGISDNQIYTATKQGLVALRSADGSLAWTFVGTDIQHDMLLMGGNPAEPILLGSSAQRLAASNGQPRWSQSVSLEFPGLAAVHAGSLYVFNLTKIDIETGAISWSAQLPSAVYSGLGFAGDTLVAEEALYGFGYGVGLLKIDANTGQAGSPIQIQSNRGVEAITSVDANGVIYDVAEITGSSLLRLRRIDPDDGSLVWEGVSDTGEEFDGKWSPYVGTGSAGIVVAATPLDSKEFWIGMFDRDTGAKKWSFADYLYPQDLTYTTQPLIDADGSVFAAYGTALGGFQCPLTCPKRTLFKFSGQDGSILWRLDSLYGPPEYQVFPWNYLLLGSDVVIADLNGHQFTKLSGVDGSILWTSDPFRTADSALTSTNNNHILVGGDGQWGELDGATGNVLWLNPGLSPFGSEPAHGYAQAISGNGDAYSVGDVGSQGWVILSPAQKGAPEKFWKVGPIDPGISTRVLNVAVDNFENPWVRVVQRFRGGPYGAASFLAKFNPQTGELADQQFLYANDISSVTQSYHCEILAAPEGNRVLVSGYFEGAPRLTTSRDALLDTTIVAHGELALTASTSSAIVKSGDILNFHFIATYTGNTAITAAHLIADVPWHSVNSSISCTTHSASNCVIAPGGDNVRVSFDVQPGGSVDVAGQVTVTPSFSDTQELHGIVFGPTGLAESDTSNNFGRAIVIESLFKNGFELVH